MHSATETICGKTSCRTLIMARSLRLSALGSVIKAKSSSVSFSSSARKRKTLDMSFSFHAQGELFHTLFDIIHHTSLSITIPCIVSLGQASGHGIGRKKDPLACHAERERSIRGDQLVSLVTADAALPLSMTRKENESECVVARGVGGLGENDAGAGRRAGAAGDGQARLDGEKALVQLAAGGGGGDGEDGEGFAAGE